MEDNTQKNSAVWYTIGAIVIVIAVYLLFFKSPSETINSPEESTATTTDGIISSGGNVAIEVSDQFGTSTAIIDKVITDAPSWVVVHEDLGGKPGRILGASFVPAGETLNLTVEFINNATAKEGQTYYAMIHTEDEVAGFDFKTDLPVTDASGNPIMKSYKIIFDKN